jgi:hypothetical protein
MVIANILGILIFLFLIWKKLKEDYSYEKIFSLATLILTCLLVGFLISKKILPEFWFFLELIGVGIGFTIGILKYKLKFFETFEGVIIGLLPIVTLFFLSDSIKNSSLSSFLAFWLSLICIFLFFLVNTYYRSFPWYKSGRVGFSGVFIAGLFFLIRALISLFFPDVISLSGNFEGLISGTLAFILFLLLFNLSRSEK